MKRFGIVVAGIGTFALVLALAGCYVVDTRRDGYREGYYRGSDGYYYRYDNRYDRYDRRGDR